MRTQAKILEVAEKGMAVTSGPEGVVANTELALKVKLEITPPDGTPAFQVTERFRFSQFGVPSAGGLLAVIYDPTDHDKVILDESPEALQSAMLAGAGIDQDQIAQALEAAKNWQQPHGGGAAPAEPDRVGQLERLAKLHESGALTDAEFAQEKAKILSE